MPYSYVGFGNCLDKNGNLFSSVVNIGGVNSQGGTACDSYCQQNPMNELVGFQFNRFPGSQPECMCLFSGGHPNPLPTYNPPITSALTHSGNGPIDRADGITGYYECYRYRVSTVLTR